jgi:hypothetical protein
MWVAIIKAISTPLSFYVLSLLIVEATLGLVLEHSKLNEEHVWSGFFVMLGLFLMVFVVVTALTIWSPKNLLFGQEEHANPKLDHSALRDQIEDLIAANVNAECLIKRK